MEEPIVIDLSAREKRLYERFRAKWAAADSGSSSYAGAPLRSGLADVAFLLPDLVVLLARLMRDSRVPLGAKAIALGGLGYVISPIDLLPEFLLGPLGLLDDVLVVAAALSRLMNEVHPDVVRDHWAGKGDALEAIQSVTDWAENLITDKMPSFVRRLLGRSG